MECNCLNWIRNTIISRYKIRILDMDKFADSICCKGFLAEKIVSIGIKSGTKIAV